MSLELCMGNQALALGALRAGVNVVSGYPGTPSSEVLEAMAAHVAALGLDGTGRPAVHVEWSTNEKAALEVGAGASFAGARALVTMKQVGLNVASDALMSLPYLGVQGGLVLIVADDPGPISSQTEQDTRQYAQFAKVPLLDPSTPEEALAMVPYAFDLSERYATPVIVRPTTRICHGTAPVETEVAFVPHAIDGFSRGPRWVVFPRRAFEGHLEINERLARIAAEFSGLGAGAAAGACEAEAGRELEAEDATIGIAAGGISYAYLHDALAQLAQELLYTPPLSFRAKPRNLRLRSSRLRADASPRLQLGADAPKDSSAEFILSTAKDLRFARNDSGGVARGDSGGVSGGVYGNAQEDSPAARVPLRLLKVSTPFPFPETAARAFLEGLDKVLVFEELEPVIERELLQCAGRHHLPVEIHGKLTGHAATAGENSVASIEKQLRAYLQEQLGEKSGGMRGGAVPHGPNFSPQTASVAPAAPTTSAAPPAPSASDTPVAPTLPARPPVLCAGCPHRASFFAVKRALRGRKAVFSGDIGCYTLGNALPLDMVDTCVCMGAGLTIPQGMDWAQPDVAHLGFVGDSTFFASGLTGVVNAAYNQADVTLCILDNSTTAMTGSQPHPGTGMRMSADASARDAERALRIPGILRALGVGHVAEADPFETRSAIETVRAAVAFKGPSAVVFRAPCITVAAPKPRMAVSNEACTGCLVCFRSIGCPALMVQDDQVAVDKALCYGCGLCASLCAFDAIAPVADKGGTAGGTNGGAPDTAAGGAETAGAACSTAGGKR
ncbi:MAG: hypothetical protein LBL86_02750 [Coriobacteriales bacterium]|jgi:indolepyruvate ferredoxin oxidoreductase alpha subunit|nr:hypothetical protein [Coriobacteriales bacterium]